MWGLLKIGYRLWSAGRLPAGDRGPAILAVFQSLGGLWIKVGQQCASRYDALPADICDALTVLYAGADGLTGSVCTVRREGNRAIKELDPSAVARFQGDLALMTQATPFVRLVLPQLQWPRLVEELRSMVIEETDLRYEAARQRRARTRMKAHGLKVPRLYLDDCTASRIEMEWIEGIRLVDYLALDQHERRREWPHPSKRIPKLVLKSLLRQIFEEPEIHTDMHPGNILLTKKGDVVLIDFGGMAVIDGDFLARFRAFIRAIATQHFTRASQLFCLLCEGLHAGFFASRRIERLQRQLVVVMQT